MDAVKKLDCEHSGEGEQVSTEFLVSGTLYRLNSPPPGTIMVAGMFVQLFKDFRNQNCVKFQRFIVRERDQKFLGSCLKINYLKIHSIIKIRRRYNHPNEN